MEYTLRDFTARLKGMMQTYMPVDSEMTHTIKRHKGHMNETALGANGIIPVGLDSMYFEIGNENAERINPNYHILEDAQVITKKGRAGKQTKGSQDLVKDLGKRDYGQATISWTKNKSGGYSKNVYYEYRKNVRGKRSLISNASRKVINDNGKIMRINRQSKYYVNEHYHYIEKELDFITKTLAYDYGMKLMRIKIDKYDKYELEGAFYDIDAIMPDSFGEGA